MLELIHGDRRSRTRYAVELNLRFVYADSQGISCVGSGVTVDLSRGGVRFRTEDPPPPGSRLQVHIAWPFKLQEIASLELLVEGQVIRRAKEEATMRISRYEFRTCGEQSFSEREDPQPRPFRIA